MEAPLLLPISTVPTASSCIDIITSAADDSTTPSPSIHPPPSPSPSSSSTSSSFVLRLAILITVACASLLAHHEAGKGFAVAVVNDAPRGSAAARRFDLLFVSNGRAQRSLLRASRAVERALFPDPSFPRRLVRRVTLRLAATNLTSDGSAAAAAATAEVLAAAAPGEYVVSLSPSLAGDDVAAALRRAVARMWLWDGRGAAPPRVTEAMVEYLAGGDGAAAAVAGEEEDAGVGCSSSMWSAAVLRQLEERREGFVARLNRAMKDRWSDAAVDAALGSPARLTVACHQLAGKTTTATPLTTGRQDDDPNTAAARGSSVAM